MKTREEMVRHIAENTNRQQLETDVVNVRGGMRSPGSGLRQIVETWAFDSLPDREARTAFLSMDALRVVCDAQELQLTILEEKAAKYDDLSR